MMYAHYKPNRGWWVCTELQTRVFTNTRTVKCKSTHTLTERTWLRHLEHPPCARLLLQGELVVLYSANIKEVCMGVQIGFRAEKVVVVMSSIPRWLGEVMHRLNYSLKTSLVLRSTHKHTDRQQPAQRVSLCSCTNTFQSIQRNICTHRNAFNLKSKWRLWHFPNSNNIMVESLFAFSFFSPLHTWQQFPAGKRVADDWLWYI